MDLDLHFPLAGIDVSQAVGRQPNRPVGGGKYARTCPVGQNVRGLNVEGRLRGGGRAGLEKFLSAQVAGTTYLIQDVGTVAVIDPGGAVQGSQQGRAIYDFAVVQGVVYYAAAGASAWTAATNNASTTPPLNSTGIVRHAVNGQKVYFVDGTHMVYFDPLTLSVEDWVASAGDLPTDSDGNKPRLICNWRDRIVLSGLIKDPQNWFASKVSDPTNFDYFPDVPVPPDSAIAGNTAPQGLAGGNVTALIPYNDDVLVLGMDHSIAVFNGDPGYGGAIDLVTTAIGIAWGEAFAMDPRGVLYFFSSRTGVYKFVPGAQPQRMSYPIDSLFLEVDTGEYGIRLAWNDRFRGLHVFASLLASSFSATHYFWEEPTNAWWTDTFTDPNMNPLAVCVSDGNTSGDRIVKMGSWDGYVRSFSPDATDDDGEDIESEVWIGPFLTNLGDSTMLEEIQAILGADSGDVVYDVFVGDTAEEALSGSSVASGTWSEGRNYSDKVQRAGYAAYIRITAGVAWALESIRAVVSTRGKVRQRGK